MMNAENTPWKAVVPLKAKFFNAMAYAFLRIQILPTPSGKTFAVSNVVEILFACVAEFWDGNLGISGRVSVPSTDNSEFDYEFSDDTSSKTFIESGVGRWGLQVGNDPVSFESNDVNSGVSAVTSIFISSLNFISVIWTLVFRFGISKIIFIICSEISCARSGS